LKNKAAAVGLSEPEAGELGRLLAAAAGRAYSDAPTEHAKTLAEQAAKEKAARRRRRGPFGFLARKDRHQITSTVAPAKGAENDPPADEEGREAA
jgi:hypothetical protein